MNEDTPWQGPRKKSQQFMQMIVKAFTKLGTIIIDYLAAIGDFLYLCFYPWMTCLRMCFSNGVLMYILDILGSSIQTCRDMRRHILAFEEDKKIFDGLITSIMHSTVVPKLAAM